ncbi:hypothetical protein HB780_10165 (plasmid) [Rhizobium lusitanum]|uniref:hypothetical protein n=1 Tax=Rhizobium lusitanum TaxID=293958 RepID=UPI0016173C79|nr:hypothetical protein [Rhizobium lusitanum]QND44779.1 hypothetical protein HB780_10165 [Rhizobium lusitanum]
MENLQEFAASSNGDQWLLAEDPVTEQIVILHRGNRSSGGHETRLSVEVFLRQTPRGPEHDALLTLLNKKGDQDRVQQGAANKTPSLKLAEEYMQLGGRRRAKVDDNIISTRKWENEPAEAEAFWKENIEPMDEKQRQEVELHLPSINDV